MLRLCAWRHAFELLRVISDWPVALFVKMRQPMSCGDLSHPSHASVESLLREAINDSYCLQSWRCGSLCGTFRNCCWFMQTGGCLFLPVMGYAISDIYSPNHVFKLPWAILVLNAMVQLVMILFKHHWTSFSSQVYLEYQVSTTGILK